MLKRFISILLTVVMVSTFGVGMNFGQNVEVKAATVGITNGATYTIVSAYNGKAITQTDLSTFYANCVVWNTDAMSDLARWTLKETGDYYNITNVVSGKSIKITGKNSGDNMDLNGNDNSDKYRSQLYDSPAIIITDYDHSQGKCCHQPVLPGTIGLTALSSCHIANGNGV